MGDLQEQTAVSAEEKQLTSTSSNPDSSTIGAERWAVAEKAARKIIYQFQPTVVSDRRRNQVINFVRKLIKKCIDCEAFSYGSVPLRTYLPDGDIDMTAFGNANIEEALANNIVSELQREENNAAAEFVVKEIQMIHAEVKLVKCLVQNIVVDISFNQIGGLCTLCFLEQVDHLIGKDHLFKRSIILIKAWCYYESRILGAHHGLISTYALETLVLYIFQVFHSTLDGPLAVLYKFLDYFSKFDWENYCISLRGPVRISSLRKLETETPENNGGDLLLSEDFYRYCVNTFSVPSKGVEMNTKTFPQKHLNIVDPLKESNNLGRSVSKGNFYRIRSAFTFGARKLGQILMQPEDSVADELHTFFSNTLDRHGNGQRPDVQDAVHMSCPSFTHPALPIAGIESNLVEKVSSSAKSVLCIGLAEGYEQKLDGALQDEVYVITALDEEMKFRTANGQQSRSMSMSQNTEVAVEGNDGPGSHFSGDAEEFAISKIQDLKISNDSQRISNSREERNFSDAKIQYAPHLYFSNHLSGNEKSKYGSSTIFQSENQENELLSGVSQENDKGRGTNIGYDLGSEVWRSDKSNSVHSVPYPVTVHEDSHYVNCTQTSASNSACPESSNSLLDLKGDYSTHFNCLLYGRRFYECALSAPLVAPSPPPSFHFQNVHSSDIQYSPLQHGFPNGSANGFIQNPVFYPVTPVIVPGVPFSLEEILKPRGTGTYFPNMNRPPQGYRPSAVKVRNQAPVRSPRNSGRAFTFSELPVDQVGGVPGFPEMHHSGSPGRKVYHNVNGTIPSNGVAETGFFWRASPRSPLVESIRPQRPASSLHQASSHQGTATLGARSPNAVIRVEDDRCMVVPSSYRLKDEEDFPPLTV